jgi:spore germination protein Q
MVRCLEDIKATVFITHPKIVKHKGGIMTYFDDLNPFLVRQDGNTSQNGSPSTSNTSSNTNTTVPSGIPTPPITPPPIIEQTYIENILRINIGKSGRFYFSYDDSTKWRDQMYRGVIEQAGRDHFVIHDPVTNKRYLLQLVYFDWAEFDEELNYQVPYV